MATIVTRPDGSKVIVVSDSTGSSQGPIKCKDELTAALLSGYINKYQKITKPTSRSGITEQDGYPCPDGGRILVRYKEDTVLDVGRAPNYKSAEKFYHGKGEDAPFPQDEKLVNEVLLAFNAAKDAETKIPDKGFISKPVYRVEPKNGQFYWFAERYLDDKKIGCDMRCANKAVAEALCASDMRHGRAVSAMNQGHFAEAGDRYIRMERGLVTEVHDAGNERANYAYRDKRAAEYGPCKYGSGIADPDPEPVAEAVPEAKPKDNEQKAAMGFAAAVVEVSNSQLQAQKTGKIPKPSAMLLSGYQTGCACGICKHINDWKKQEAAEVDKAAQALQAASKVISDVKAAGVKDAADLNVAANVKQVDKSQETNKENQAMANDKNNEKPTADTRPARQPSQIELEARAAALRTGMKQLTKLIHEPLAAALAAQLTPPGSDPSAMKAQVAAFLKSELGSAVVSAMLSLAINSIPANMIPGFTAERQSLVAQELRVKAMTEVGDTLVDLVAAPLRAALAGLMTGPAAEALTGVRAEDAGLDGASTAQEEAPAVAQTDNVKKVNFG